MFKCIYNGEKEKAAGKNVFGATIKKMVQEDSKVCYLDADLMNSIGTFGLEADYPDQIIECGIQEANMVGVAAGMSATGMKPFVHTFGSFAGRRVFDQAFMSVAYAKNNVVIIGSDSGINAAYNGGTHMPFEDICLYRAIPEALVIDATDSAMLASILPALKDRKGLTYVRICRKNCVAVYSEDSTFEFGKGNVLRDGKDVTFIAAGYMVSEALKAAEMLHEEGIEAAVIDMFCIKPLDEALVLEYAKKTGAVVTAENGNVVGGLGAAVAEVLGENCPTPISMVGIRDRFGQVGTVDFLAETYGLTAAKMVEAARKTIARK